MKEATVRNLLFAGDCALNAGSETEMQQSMNNFSSACDSFGLAISTKKTVVMFQPVLRSAYTEPSITVKGETLKVVDSFPYLSTVLSRSVHNDNEICCQNCKGQCGICQTQNEGLGKEWSDHEDKTKGVQGCCLTFSALLQ